MTLAFVSKKTVNCVAEKYESKLSLPKVESCSLSSGMEPHHLAVYTPAHGGQPAVVQLRRYGRKL